MKKEQDQVYELLSQLVDSYLNLPVGTDQAPQASEEFIEEAKTTYLVAELLIDQINQKKARPDEVIKEIEILYDDFISEHQDKPELHDRLKHFCQQAQARTWIAFANLAIPYIKEGSQDALSNFRYAYKQCTLHLIQAELVLKRRTPEISASIVKSLFNADFTDLSLKVAKQTPEDTQFVSQNFSSQKRAFLNRNNPPASMSSLN